MWRHSGSQSAFCTGAEEVERARNRRIKVCEEMGPEGFTKEILDGLERSMEINGRQSIPEANNSGEVRVVSEVSLRGKMFQF